MILIRSQFYNVLMYISILVYGLAYMPWILSSRDGAYKAIRAWTKLNRFLIKNICGITYEIRGNAPTEPALVCSKHMNFLDIVILAESVPQPKFILKAQLRYVPIIGIVAKKIGSAPVHRGKDKATQRMLKEIETGEHANPDGQLIIYPQGTRVLPDAKIPYKSGAWRIYDAKKLPTYFVATNSGVVWSRRSAFRYPGHVIVEYLSPRIEIGLGRDAFMNEMSERIEQESNRLMKEFPANK